MQVIKEIPLQQIAIPEERLTSQLTEEEFTALTESIRAEGLICPILLTTSGPGFILVSGLNRLRAAQAIGWKTIPSIIIHADSARASILNITENLARGKTNPIHEAYAIVQLGNVSHMSLEEISGHLKRPVSWLNSRLLLLDLPDGLQEVIQNGQLSMAAAKELSVIQDPHILEYLVNQAIESGASVKTIHAWLGKMDQNALNAALMMPSQATPRLTPEELNPTIDCFACGAANQPHELRPELLCENCRGALHSPILQPAPGTGPG